MIKRAGIWGRVLDRFTNDKIGDIHECEIHPLVFNPNSKELSSQKITGKILSSTINKPIKSSDSLRLELFDEKENKLLVLKNLVLETNIQDSLTGSKFQGLLESESLIKD